MTMREYEEPMCPKCGAALEYDWEWCPWCGEQLYDDGHAADEWADMMRDRLSDERMGV